MIRGRIKLYKTRSGSPEQGSDGLFASNGPIFTEIVDERGWLATTPFEHDRACGYSRAMTIAFVETVTEKIVDANEVVAGNLQLLLRIEASAPSRWNIRAIPTARLPILI